MDQGFVAATRDRAVSLGKDRFVRFGLTGIIAASLALPAAAMAQDAQPSDNASGLEEIIVTAQRRSENLQQVPISVSAITSDRLEAVGMDSTLSLPQAVPSVQITKSGIASIFFIRGVGNTSGGTGEEGANAFYIDGVYLADLQQANTEFNNIERVEVLKGPQGTLFGRNASGGLINIITKEPGATFTARGNIGYGNYDTIDGQVYVAGPLSETVSADLALTGRKQHDGFGINLATGEDNMLGWHWGARSKIVLKPNDGVKLVAAGDYWHARDTYSSAFTIDKGSFLAAPAGTPVGTPGTLIGPAGNLVYGYAGDYNNNSPDPSFVDIEVWGASLTGTFDLGIGELTSLTAIRRLDAISNVDSDYGPPRQVQLRIPSFSKTFQQEVRLASNKGGAIDWQFGVFYFHAKSGVNNQILLGPGGPNSGQITNSKMTTDSYAAFGEVTWHATPTTHLTGGLRYTKEDRHLVGNQRPLNQTLPALIASFTTNPVDDISYKKLTFRAAVRQDISDDLNVYASFNRGFKAGLWQLNSPAAPPVKPQTTDAYEVGMKAELFDRILRLNIAGYHYKVDDYQVRAAPLNAANPILLNATSVKITGLEAGLELAPTEGLTLFSEINIIRAKFGDFPNAPFTYPNPAVCSPGQTPAGRTTGPQTGGNITCLGNARGNRVPITPKFSASVGVNYVVPTGGDTQLEFNALFSHNSGYFFEQDNRLRQKAFNLLSGSIEYRFSKNLGIELWAKNLTNTFYWVDKLGSGPASRGEAQPPRTFGARFKFDY